MICRERQALRVAVVYGARDNWAIRIGFEKTYDHFLPHTRDPLVSPAHIRPVLGDAQIAGIVAVLFGAVPMKANLNPAELVRVDLVLESVRRWWRGRIAVRLAGISADHNGCLHARNHRNLRCSRRPETAFSRNAREVVRIYERLRCRVACTTEIVALRKVMEDCG